MHEYFIFLVDVWHFIASHELIKKNFLKNGFCHYMNEGCFKELSLLNQVTPMSKVYIIICSLEFSNERSND